MTSVEIVARAIEAFSRRDVETIVNELVHPDIEKRDLSSLTSVTVGGAPAGPDLMAELEAALAPADVICDFLVDIRRFAGRYKVSLRLRRSDLGPWRSDADRCHRQTSC